MTIPAVQRTAGIPRPDYMRRLPGWADGVGRLLDVFGTFDLQIPPRAGVQPDIDALRQDRCEVVRDLHSALDQLRDTVAR